MARCRPSLLMGHIGTLAVNPSLYSRLPYRGTAPAVTDLIGGQIRLALEAGDGVGPGAGGLSY